MKSDNALSVEGMRHMEDSVQGRLDFGRVVVFGVVVVCAFSSGALGQAWDGNGVEGDPYQIWTAEDMQAIGADANYWGAHFLLCADIDLSAYTGTSFNMIGNCNFEGSFKGVFDGGGHTISNFTFDSNDVNCVGLFRHIGYVSYPAVAEISNLRLVDPNIHAGTGVAVGSLVGHSWDGAVINCFVEGGNVSGNTYVGGLVGVNTFGEIANSYSTSSVTGVNHVGGLVGDNGGNVMNCYSTGIVDGNNYTGGLIGYNYFLNGEYTACFWNVSVNPDVNGIGNGSDPNVIGKTTAEMQTESTYTDAGWDFNTPIWTICEGEDYPRLWWEKYGGGNGTEANPYLIRTSCQLNAIGDEPNDWDKHFVMVDDINLSGIVYSRAVIAPDTNNTNWDFDGTPFTGTFNGSNHTIHNLTIDTADSNNDYLGLFGQLRSSTIVSNLRLQNANITGGTNSVYVGGLIGSNGDWGYAGGIISNCYSNGSVTCGNSSYAVGGMVGFSEYGTISNCYTSGSVSGDDYIGGMVGHNDYGTIFNCYNSNGHVTGGDSSYAVGGLIGYNEYGTVSNCGSNGYVTGEDNSYAVGGLVGEHYDGSISNCYATGFVNADDTLGSLVGRIYYGSVSNCYSAGTVTGESYTIGGLVGYNYRGNIINCYATDSVSGGDESERLGGLVGWNGGAISNCYSGGSVTGGIGSGYLGGLVGRNTGDIIMCYSATEVAGANDVGGLIGYDNGGAYSSSFWDSDINPDVNGISNIDDPNVVGLPTVLMQTESTFTDAGWDFVGEVINGPNDIWDICEGTNYPKFVWQIPFGDFVCPDGVTLVDYSYFAGSWYAGPGDGNWDPNCDISEPNDNFIDERDLSVFTENYLTGF